MRGRGTFGWGCAEYERYSTWISRHSIRSVSSPRVGRESSRMISSIIRVGTSIERSSSRMGSLPYTAIAVDARLPVYEYGWHCMHALLHLIYSCVVHVSICTSILRVTPFSQQHLTHSSRPFLTTPARIALQTTIRLLAARGILRHGESTRKRDECEIHLTTPTNTDARCNKQIQTGLGGHRFSRQHTRMLYSIRTIALTNLPIRLRLVFVSSRGLNPRSAGSFRRVARSLLTCIRHGRASARCGHTRA